MMLAGVAHFCIRRSSPPHPSQPLLQPGEAAAAFADADANAESHDADHL